MCWGNMFGSCDNFFCFTARNDVDYVGLAAFRLDYSDSSVVPPVGHALVD